MEWFKGSVGEAIGVAKQAGGLIAFQVVDTGEAAEDTMKAWSAAQVFTPLIVLRCHVRKPQSHAYESAA